MFRGTSLFQPFQDTGYISFFGPLLVVFLLFYYILKTTGLFESRRIRVSVAVVLSLLISIYTPFRTGEFLVYMSNLIGAVAVFGFVIVGFLVVEALGSKKQRSSLREHYGKILGVLAVSFLVLFVLQGGLSVLSGKGYFRDFNFIVSRYEVLSLLITGTVLGIVLSFLKEK